MLSPKELLLTNMHILSITACVYQLIAIPCPPSLCLPAMHRGSDTLRCLSLGPSWGNVPTAALLARPSLPWRHSALAARQTRLV